MFPISDSIKSKGFPIVTILLIAVTIFVFIKEILSPNIDTFITHYALIPSLVHMNDPITWFPFITSIFLHGGILHILSNMWFLWIFGNHIENYVGKFNYLLLYFFSGILGNFVQYILMPHSSLPMLGASGAIAGVLGTYFILFPYSKIKTIVPILFFLTILDISAPIILGYWFVLQIVSGAVSLPLSSSGGVAFWAHVGGFLTGVIIGKMFKKSVNYNYG